MVTGLLGFFIGSNKERKLGSKEPLFDQTSFSEFKKMEREQTPQGIFTVNEASSAKTTRNFYSNKEMREKLNRIASETLDELLDNYEESMLRNRAKSHTESNDSVVDALCYAAFDNSSATRLNKHGKDN